MTQNEKKALEGRVRELTEENLRALAESVNLAHEANSNTQELMDFTRKVSEHRAFWLGLIGGSLGATIITLIFRMAGMN